VVALDEEGRSSFQLLQALEMEDEKRLCALLRSAPTRRQKFARPALEQRKQSSPKFAKTPATPIRYSGEISGDVKSCSPK